MLTPTEAQNLIFKPAPNFNGNPGNLEFFVTDNSGNVSPPAPVTISVTPVNDLPVAGTVPRRSRTASRRDPEPDPRTTSRTATELPATTPEDTPVSGQINATDVDLDTLIYSKAATRPTARVTVNPDGSWTYTPNPDYNGPDQFDVIVDDGNGGTDKSTVFIEVTPVDDQHPPAGRDGVETTPEDTPYTVHHRQFRLQRSDRRRHALPRFASTRCPPGAACSSTARRWPPAALVTAAQIAAGLLKFVPAARRERLAVQQLHVLGAGSRRACSTRSPNTFVAQRHAGQRPAGGRQRRGDHAGRHAGR